MFIDLDARPLLQSFQPYTTGRLQDKYGCPTLLGLSPLGFQHEDVGLHDDIGLQSKLVSRPLFGLQVVAKANQTGYSVVPPPAQAKADHGVLGIMSSSCSKECELN